MAKANMSDTEKSIYEKLRKYYTHTIKSDQFQEWHDNIRVPCWNFYDGIQWSEADAQTLKERGQAPIVINMIKPRVDSLVGLGIQNSTKIAFTPRTFQEQDRLLAQAATAFAYQIQDINDYKAVQRDTDRSMWVSGLGCQYITESNDRIYIKHVPDGEIIYDIDDMTSDFSNSQYRGRVVWWDIDKAKSIFKNKSKEIDELVASETKKMPQETSSTMGFEDQEVDPFDDLLDVKLNKIRIVEIQYKKITTGYTYETVEGRFIQVFDKDVAEENKADGTEVLEAPAVQIWSGFFTQDILLSHLPLPVQSGEFEYVLTCANRRHSDLVPYGNVYSALDPQREYNKRRSKLLHLLNANQAIFDGDAFEDIEHIRRQLARPDGMIAKKAGSDVRIAENRALASDQFRIMEQSYIELQRAMGVPEELVGDTSNATSGVAIRQRQQAAALKQTPMFDIVRQARKKVGRLLLGFIQNTGPNKAAQIIDPDNPENVKVIPFNITYERNGKEYRAYDMSTVNFDVAVIEEPDYVAPPEELAQNLTQIIMNGQLQAFLQMPTLMKQIGVRNSEQILKELQAAQPQQGAVSPDGQGTAGAQGGQQQPTPQQPSLFTGG